MPGIARATQFQLIHYLRKLVNFNDPGIAAGVVLGTLPAGAQITDIGVNFTTAFNAATPNTLLLAPPAGGSQLATAADTAAGTAGFKRVTTGAAPPPPAADTDVFVTFT